MYRILLLSALATIWCAVATATDTPVGLVAALQGGAVVSLDASFPAGMNMTAIQSDLQQVAQRTGWRIEGQPAETEGDTISVHAQVMGGEVASVLNDVVWPLVAAMARHERLGIMVTGAPAAVAPMVVENRFVRLEQSGGQGILSYQAFVKDSSFESLDELMKPDLPGASTHRGSRLGWAWFFLVVTAMAVGVLVYLLMRRRGD
ncbi:hypothetical protein LLH23_14385 [bacterium]|nr:hypothetical protein [bacterium]